MALKKPSALVESCYQYSLLLHVLEKRGLDERQREMETSDTKERNLTGNELTGHCIIQLITLKCIKLQTGCVD